MFCNILNISKILIIIYLSFFFAGCVLYLYVKWDRMNSEYDDLVNALKDKIFRLILLYEEEKRKNEVLSKDKDYLEVQLNEKRKMADEFNQKYENLKLGKMIEITGSDIHDARIKINRIVREVDQCIALLNK